jgi:hypothetical protein
MYQKYIYNHSVKNIIVEKACNLNLEACIQTDVEGSSLHPH